MINSSKLPPPTSDSNKNFGQLPHTKVLVLLRFTELHELHEKSCFSRDNFAPELIRTSCLSKLLQILCNSTNSRLESNIFISVAFCKSNLHKLLVLKK